MRHSQDKTNQSSAMQKRWRVKKYGLSWSSCFVMTCSWAGRYGSICSTGSLDCLHYIACLTPSLTLSCSFLHYHFPAVLLVDGQLPVSNTHFVQVTGREGCVRGSGTVTSVAAVVLWVRCGIGVMIRAHWTPHCPSAQSDSSWFIYLKPFESTK